MYWLGDDKCAAGKTIDIYQKAIELGLVKMPEYCNKGYAQQAMLAVEEIYGYDHWCLDTILQEEGTLHLYEKLGYRRTGTVDRINDRIDIVYLRCEVLYGMSYIFTKQATQSASALALLGWRFSCRMLRLRR